MNLVENVSYSERDYNKLKAELQKLIPSLTDRWTDYNESDVGIVLVDLIAYLGDLLSFYLDRQALETYAPTASLYQNLRSILSPLGLRPRQRVSALCNVRFKFNKAYFSNVKIPKYTMVSSVGNTVLIYCTTKNVYLPSDGSYIDIPCMEGTPKQSSLAERNFSSANTFAISDYYIAEGSVQLSDGVSLWEEVPNVYFSSKKNKKIYSVELNESLTYTITLPLNWKDIINNDPLRTESWDGYFSINYVVSNGKNGTIGKNKLIKLVSSIYDDGNADISSRIVVTNLEDSKGGQDEETMDSLKSRAESTIKTLGSLIRLSDFQTYSETYPGIARALVFDWNSMKSITNPYEINICLIPQENNVASDALKSQFLEDINKVKFATCRLKLIDADYIPVSFGVDITLKPYPKSSSLNAEYIRSMVNSVITTFFSPSSSNINFNQTVYMSELTYAIFQSFSYISRVRIYKYDNSSELFDDINLSGLQFPVLDSVNINIIETN